MSAMTQLRSNGITAQVASARVTETSGASRKTAFEVGAGMTGSFRTNFSRSAND